VTVPRIVAARDDDEPPDEAPTEVIDAGAPGSVLARLRERAKATQQARTLDKVVPGWEGELVVRFKPLDMATVDRFVGSLSDSSVLHVTEAVDLVARACVGVYANAGGQLEQLADEDGPVRIEHRLAVLLGYPVPPEAKLTAREVILALFGGEALPLTTWAGEVASWMTDREAEPEAGES
jgi:hypothetical protein